VAWGQTITLEPATFHQIRLLGVNLNQIARRLNVQDMPAPPALAPLLAEIHAVLQKALTGHDPNIETGKSFRGAQLYYLHDKWEAKEQLRLSDERVIWTETRNTAHDAAEHAFAEMIATARDQDQLKIISGERLSGRPLRTAGDDHLALLASE
jgi:Bacterial mobilisation protein (MobC)